MGIPARFEAPCLRLPGQRAYDQLRRTKNGLNMSITATGASSSRTAWQCSTADSFAIARVARVLQTCFCTSLHIHRLSLLRVLVLSRKHLGAMPLDISYRTQIHLTTHQMTTPNSYVNRGSWPSSGRIAQDLWSAAEPERACHCVGDQQVTATDASTARMPLPDPWEGLYSTANAPAIVRILQGHRCELLLTGEQYMSRIVRNTDTISHRLRPEVNDGGLGLRLVVLLSLSEGAGTPPSTA